MFNKVLVILGSLIPFLWVVIKTYNLAVLREYSIYNSERMSKIVEQYLSVLKKYALFACFLTPIISGFISWIIVLSIKQTDYALKYSFRTTIFIFIINAIILIILYILRLKAI